MQKSVNNKKHLQDIRAQLTNLLTEDDVTKDDVEELKSKIHQLQKQMDQMQHTMFKVDIQTYRINDSLIRIEEYNSAEFNLSLVSPTNKSIHCEKKTSAARSNEQRCFAHVSKSLFMFVRSRFEFVEKKSMDFW